MRMARKPSAVARELLRNFPKGGKRRRKRGKRGQQGENGGAPEGGKQGGEGEAKPRKKRPRKRRKAGPRAETSSGAGEVDLAGTNGDAVAAGGDDKQVAPVVDAVGDA
jgi:hypothetical protein